MSDQSVVPPNDDANYPPPFLPAVFIDGVTSVTWVSSVAKFYLSRFEPHLRASGPSREQPIVQVIMPVLGFVHAALFFERVLKRMIDDGTLTQAQVDELRQKKDSTDGA